ncbi:hypothetical protein C1646_770898 [Rhizophagus diaphanus]|nr:hypothetical protein C1646_770898 [Rhizophagus diaphanus] [Rhizophagus sp. MUCL 43196]
MEIYKKSMEIVVTICHLCAMLKMRCSPDYSCEDCPELGVFPSLSFLLYVIFNENNSLSIYLKNGHIKQLNEFLNTEDSSIGFWIELANKAVQVLESISLKVLNLFCQNLAGIIIRIIRYHRSIPEDAINNPNLCHENVARFKRLLDSLHYKNNVVVMTDCTILKSRLQYSTNLGCIVRSTLDQNNCKIETYDNIYKKISDIKQRNVIAKYVKIYVLQVPLSRFSLVIVILIPTGNNSANKILVLHQKLIDIAADFELPIISIRSD